MNSLMKRNPFEALNEPFFGLRPFRDNFSKLFEGDLLQNVTTISWQPKVDIRETEDKIVAELECAGLSAKDLDISVEGRVLTVKGEKKDERESNKDNYHVMERSYGKFVRSFNLSSIVNPETIDATYRNGVVTIEMEKKEEYKPKKIEIKELTEGGG